MRYMLLINIDNDERAKLSPEETNAIFGEYGALTQRLIESGELVAGDALQGNDTATSLRVRDGKAQTTDGPFAETKEVLGGYYVVNVSDLDRALAVAAEIPDARYGGIEVRPIWEM